MLGERHRLARVDLVVRAVRLDLLRLATRTCQRDFLLREARFAVVTFAAERVWAKEWTPDHPQARQAAYAADITYGTNNEFGFDYLRDNMKFDRGSLVQRELNYAIVDEVDSILIDEARTPLIISGPAEKSTDLYYQVNTVIPRLQKERDYTVDEKAHSSMLTDQGVDKVEKRLAIGNLYDPANLFRHNQNIPPANGGSEG